jgi:hypothetical protein
MQRERLHTLAEQTNRIIAATSLRRALERRSEPRDRAASRLGASQSLGTTFPVSMIETRLHADTPVSFWLIRRRVAELTLALLAALAVGLLIVKLQQSGTFEWIQNRAPIGWTLLGLWWSLCLAPGWFGIVLICIALLDLILRRRSAPELVNSEN